MQGSVVPPRLARRWALWPTAMPAAVSASHTAGAGRGAAEWRVAPHPPGGQLPGFPGKATAGCHLGLFARFVLRMHAPLRPCPRRFVGRGQVNQGASFNDVRAAALGCFSLLCLPAGAGLGATAAACAQGSNAHLGAGGWLHPVHLPAALFTGLLLRLPADAGRAQHDFLGAVQPGSRQ